MTFTDYLRDRLLLLMLQISCMMMLAAFLHATNYPASNCYIILFAWFVIFTIWFLTEYFRRSRYFRQIEDILAQADQKYLLGELMPRSFRLEDNLYRDMIRKSNKSVIEKIRSIEDARKDYREYIESWVHEIKAPIANISLLCEKQKNMDAFSSLQEHQETESSTDFPEIPDDETGHTSYQIFPHNVPDSPVIQKMYTFDLPNTFPERCSLYTNHCILQEKGNPDTTQRILLEKGNPDTTQRILLEKYNPDTTRRILQENQKTENYVDMALFYARSDEVYKDYLIKETSLQKTAEEVLQKNKYHFIECRIRAEVHCSHIVYTDTKWIAFILNQLVLNAVKYRRNTAPEIRIFTEKTSHGVCLTVADNGPGIPPEELPRIFDKGFTGSNGRTRGRSTGMGLYLCRKLCTKLGIQIHAESEENAGTRIMLEFPVSSYLARP